MGSWHYSCTLDKMGWNSDRSWLVDFSLLIYYLWYTNIPSENCKSNHTSIHKYQIFLLSLADFIKPLMGLCYNKPFQSFCFSLNKFEQVLLKLSGAFRSFLKGRKPSKRVYITVSDLLNYCKPTWTLVCTLWILKTGIAIQLSSVWRTLKFILQGCYFRVCLWMCSVYNWFGHPLIKTKYILYQ